MLVPVSSKLFHSTASRCGVACYFGKLAPNDPQHNREHYDVNSMTLRKSIKTTEFHILIHLVPQLAISNTFANVDFPMNPTFFFHFLARLDYVSRAHDIEICPSSVIVRRPSVSQLSLNRMHGFLSNFGCCFP